MVKDRGSETGIRPALILGGVRYRLKALSTCFRTDFTPELQVLSHAGGKVKVPLADDLVPSCFPAAISPRSGLHRCPSLPLMSRPHTPSCITHQVHRPVYHMLTSSAEIYTCTAGGQVQGGFFAALLPSCRERCSEGLHMYPCDLVVFYLHFDPSSNQHIPICYRSRHHE